MSEEQKRNDGHSALRPDGKGGLETFDPHPSKTVEVQTVDGKTQQVPVEPQKPTVLAELHIVLLSDGSFQVNGPLDNPFHYHGLLGIASDALRDARARQEQSRIDLSATRGPGFLKRLLAGKRAAQGILKKE